MDPRVAIIVGGTLGVHPSYDDLGSLEDLFSDPEINLPVPTDPPEASVQGFELNNLNFYVDNLGTAIEFIVKEAYIKLGEAPSEKDVTRLTYGTALHLYDSELDVEQQDFIVTLYLEALKLRVDLLERRKLRKGSITSDIVYGQDFAGYIHVKEVHQTALGLLGEDVSDIEAYLATSVIMDRQNIKRDGNYWVREIEPFKSCSIRERAKKLMREREIPRELMVNDPGLGWTEVGPKDLYTHT